MLALAACLTLAPFPASTAGDEELFERTAPAAAEVGVNLLAATDATALAIGVLEGEQMAFFGLGTRGKAGPAVAPDSVFQLGRGSELFTAILALEAERRGELTLDAEVMPLLPEAEAQAIAFIKPRDPPFAPWPNNQPIAIRHLLKHTSGLDDAEHAIANPPGSYTRDMLRSDLADKFAEPVPGFMRKETLLDHLVLATILERVGGADYEDLLADRVLGPLGLSETFAITRDADLADRLVTAIYFGSPIEPLYLDDVPGAWGVGVTGMDMLRLSRAILDAFKADPPRDSVAGSLARLDDEPSRIRRDPATERTLGLRVDGQGRLFLGTCDWWACMMLVLDPASDRAVVVLLNSDDHRIADVPRGTGPIDTNIQSAAWRMLDALAQTQDGE